MAFCMICSCGEKVVFERRMSYPDQCPACGRRMDGREVYTEDDPRVAEKLAEVNNSAPTVPSQPVATEVPCEQPAPVAGTFRYALKLENGMEIELPEIGGIVGRTEIGAEALASYPSVSRRHLKAIIRQNIGIMIEDLSTYGTMVNGTRLEKNTPMRVAAGSTITLCNVNAVLIEKGE